MRPSIRLPFRGAPALGSLALAVLALGSVTPDVCAQDRNEPFVCPPVRGPIAIDGDLSEWEGQTPLEIGEAQFVKSDEPWAGPSDLSGRIWCARSATTLYFAGEVLDDTLFWNDQEVWKGDGVELFFDFSPNLDRRVPNSSYDAYCHQLLLYPLVAELNWTFEKLNGKSVGADAQVDGIALAGLELRDGKSGYTFELALPVSNFPALAKQGGGLAEGRVFGFDVALSDSDGQPRQKHYATLSGHENLSTWAGSFGRMRLGKEPPPVSPAEEIRLSPIEPVAFLAVLVGGLLFLWLATSGAAHTNRLAGALDRLRRLPLRPKVVTAIVLGSLVVLAGVIARTVESVLDSRDVGAKRELAVKLREIAREANSKGVLEPHAAGQAAPLIALLTGNAVKPAEKFEYTLIAPRHEAPRRTLDGIPFLHREIPAGSALPATFVVHPRVSAARATLIYSWVPASGEAVATGDAIAEFTFVHQSGEADVIGPLTLGRHVIARDAAIDPAAPETSGLTDPEAKVAYLAPIAEGSEELQNAVQLGVELPEATAGSPLVRIEVKQLARVGTFLLHGVTLHPRDSVEPVLLPLGRATETGIPTSASPFPGRQGGLQLSADQPWAFVDCALPRADRLWLVTGLRKGFKAHKFGAPVALVEAVFDDGSVSRPIRLENGLHVDLESSRGRVHDSGFKGELAFEWGEHREQRHHYDIIQLDLERPGRRLYQLQFEFTGDQEVLRVASVIAGTRVESTTEQGLPSYLGSGPEGFFLPPPQVEEFAALDFTFFRGGAAVATTAAGDAGERLLARRLTEEETARIAAEPDGLYETRNVEGSAVHVLTLSAVGGRNEEVLELSWASGADQQLTGVVTGVRLCLAALLVPTLVLVLADLVLKIPSLHVRLVAGFAAVVAIPVGLGFVAVPELIEAKIEGTEEQAVREKARVVKTHLASLQPMARRLAENAFRDEALQEALMRQGAEDFRAGVTSALRDIRRNIAASTGADTRVALELDSQSSATAEGPIRFPERSDIFPGRGGSVTDQIGYRYSRLGATGALVTFDNEHNWSRTLVVELPVSRGTLQAAIAAAGGDAQVLMYSQRGYPLASTLQLEGEDAPDELARKQAMVKRVLAEQRPAVVPRVLAGERNSVAYDVLRVAGDQLVLVATAVPRGGADAILNRIGYVSILVFGAGVFLQFLLAGLVVTSAFRPITNVLASMGGTLPSSPEERGRDELAELAGAVATVQEDRELYRAELGRLHDAVGALAGAHDPEDVVDRALSIVREAARPWGLVLLAGVGDRAEVLGGFRGDARIPLGPVPLSEGGPLHQAVRDGAEAHLRNAEELAAALGPEELRLIGVAHSLSAYPLATPASRGGALVLLEPSRTETPPPPHHGEFVATLARHVGVALENARLVRLAVRDPQTETYVGSYFEQRLKEEVDRAVSARSAIALLAVRAADVPTGTAEQERAMRRLADAVRSRIPDRAFAGRVGEDALAVAVPEADREVAEQLAIELRRTLAEPGLAGLRARVGFAACPDDAGSYEFLKLEAQRALADDGGEQPSQTVDASDRQAWLKTDARRLGAVFESAKGVQILDTVERIAGSDITILVEGETGAGKEVVADLIHRKSLRRGGPLIKVNCAALPDALLESELFGFEPGAFTGADRTKPGRFELADGGTLFLDEIGDMPLATQVKLLRVLEDRAVEHLGGTRPIPVDVRVISATNRELRTEIAAGRFREDLYYRLNAITIAVPPLRARKDDIPALAERFVRAAAETHGRKPPVLAPDAMDALFRYDWPGNVRELRNAVEQAVVLSTGDTIHGSDVQPALRGRRQTSSSRAFGAAPAANARAALPTPPGISDRQRRLLALLGEQEWITNSEYCAVVGVSTRTGLRDLQELINRGVLLMEGKRRGARYRRR